MGFSSNWMLVRGMTPEQVWEALRVRPSGTRTDFPEPPLSGSVRPDGSYLVVEDRAEEDVEYTWDLAKLSFGGEIIGVGEVDGAGGAEVVLWRDGQRVWGIAAPLDEGDPEVRGDLPTQIRAAVERDARGEPGNEYYDDPDYFNAILALGTSLTGYQCGSGIDQPGTKPFEILTGIQ